MDVYLFLLKTNEHLDLQRDIVNFISTSIKNYINVKIKIIYHKKHIIEDTIKLIDRKNSIILWQPNLAYDNLSLLKEFKNSIVILKKPTILTQKISINNPINENMALNHNFKIMYIDNTNDISNSNYQILGYEVDYLINETELVSLINKN